MLSLPHYPKQPNTPRLFSGPEQRRRELLAAWLASLGKNTLRAYAGDMKAFATHSGFSEPGPAAEWLFSLHGGDANYVVLGWKNAMDADGLSPATIGRRLSALKSLGRCARMLGCCDFTIEVDSPQAETGDMSGPGELGYARMREAAAKDSSDLGVRDYALMSLLHDLGLRRSEVAGLATEDLEIEDGTEHGIPYRRVVTVMVQSKGREKKERMTVPPSTSKILCRWLERRGAHPGWIFGRLDRGAPGSPAEPLTGESVRKIVARLSKAAGLSRTCRPHGLRHEHASRALDVTGGDVRAVAQSMRHRSISTTMRYDDRRRNHQGRIASLVAGD